MDPKRYAAKAVAALREGADARIADRAMKYFKPHEKIAVLGFSAAAIRALERRLFGEVAGKWGVDEAIACCDLMVEKKFLECKAVAILLLSRYRKTFPKSLAGRIESWLIADRCANWASCDAMCGTVIAPLLLRYPELVPDLTRWASSDCLWLRRASAVSLTPLARRGLHIDDAFQVCAALLGDKEDLVHKAVGWLLREAGKSDPRRLESFLLINGPRIPRTAVRYALERFPADRRAFLLSHTRG
jgi:3-methyladenine DNA glycosylase AlkD